MIELIKRCQFSPYRKGCGPTFRLTLWDINERDEMGKHRVQYQLTMRENGVTTILFVGKDFSCSPLHAIDSDETASGLMTFLTLRPGDTDPEYFDNYTNYQREYCEQHAEALMCECCARFGNDEQS